MEPVVFELLDVIDSFLRDHRQRHLVERTGISVNIVSNPLPAVVEGVRKFYPLSPLLTSGNNPIDDCQVYPMAGSVSA